MTTQSVLEETYVEPQRPYSQNELQHIRERNFRTLRVGDTRVHHKRCDHFYYVKHNGRKEKKAKESGFEDVGSCSVCWKFNKTHRNLKNKADSMLGEYRRVFFNNPDYLSYDNVDVENIFYRWLYEEVM